MKQRKILLAPCYLLFVIFMLAGCNTIKTTIRHDTLFAEHSKVFVMALSDPLDIKRKVEDRLRRTGFDVVDQKANAEYIIDYDYDYYYDVFHYSFNLFNLTVIKAVSNELVLTSGFSGDSLLSVDGILDSIFADITKEMGLASQ